MPPRGGGASAATASGTTVTNWSILATLQPVVGESHWGMDILGYWVYWVTLGMDIASVGRYLHNVARCIGVCVCVCVCVRIVCVCGGG